MATLNTIAENIAYKLGEQFNSTLNESIKQTFVDYRSLFIRRDLERNSNNYLQFVDSICLELELVDSSFCTSLPSNCFILRSKEKIVNPIRLKANGRSDFYFVGTVNKSKSFVYADALEMNFNTHLPLQKNTIYYGYMKDHLIVYNNTNLKKILTEFVIADPRDIKDCRNLNVLPDDTNFNIPVDMIAEISNLIIREYRNPTKDGEETNINKE